MYNKQLAIIEEKDAIINAKDREIEELKRKLEKFNNIWTKKGQRRY